MKALGSHILLSQDIWRLGELSAWARHMNVRRASPALYSFQTSRLALFSIWKSHGPFRHAQCLSVFLEHHSPCPGQHSPQGTQKQQACTERSRNLVGVHGLNGPDAPKPHGPPMYENYKKVTKLSCQNQSIKLILHHTDCADWKLDPKSAPRKDSFGS